MPKTKSDEPPEDERPSKRQRSSDGSSVEITTSNCEDVGFTLKLSDNQSIQVSKEDAELLQGSCAFFRNVFRHGTLESQDFVISKPDWSLDTASAILDLLRNQTLSVPNDYAAFKEAADQILLPIRVLHPVSGSNIKDDGELIQCIQETWKAATTNFTIDMETWIKTRRPRPNSIEAIWEELLHSGTVFVDHQHQKGLQIQMTPENAPPLPLPAKILSVGSFAPLTVSVYHTCLRLSESLRNPRVRRDAISQNKPACMALPLYCGGKQLLEEEFQDLNFLLIETNNVPTVHMTRVTTGPEGLRKVVDAAADLIAPVNLSKLIYLLIPEPDIHLLGKLITACQRCQDDPGTVGWDLQKNQFCTLKTLRDTKLILNALLDPETKMANSGTIRLVNVDMTAAPTWAPY